MPCVGRVNGLAFYVYADDHNPPHVHVFYAEFEVLLVIATSAVYDGFLPGPQLARAQAWLNQNRALVQAAWDRLNP